MELVQHFTDILGALFENYGLICYKKQLTVVSGRGSHWYLQSLLYDKILPKCMGCNPG